jgi:uncharacterized protein
LLTSTIILLVFLGVIGGILSGLIGIGGGLIFVPIFDFLLKTHDIEGSELVKFTLANSFFCIFVSGIITSYKQFRQDNFYFKEILYTAVPAIVTGGILTYFVTNSSWYSERIFKLLFIALLVYTVLKTFLKRKTAEEKELPFSVKRYAGIGLLTGIASSLSGLGGGIVMIPLFKNIIKMDMKKAASVSIGAIPILLFPMLILYAFGSPIITSNIYHWGYLTPLYVAPVAVGLWLGTTIGLKISKRITNQTLQIIFASLLTLLILKYTIELVVS